MLLRTPVALYHQLSAGELRQRQSKATAALSRVPAPARCSGSSGAASEGTSKQAAGPVKSSVHSDCKTAPKSTRRCLVMGGITAGMMVAVGCPICDQNLNLATANAAEWSYGDLSGPAEWGDVCQTGTLQSPIDIPLSSSPVLVDDNSPGPIKFGYSLASASYLNTGHGTMQVNFPAGTNKCVIGGRVLDLLQFHFHAPSEHSFNGVRTAMEAHLVHRDAEGKLAVVGVMLEASPKATRNLCVEAALAFAPDERGLTIGAPVQCFDVPVVEEGKTDDGNNIVAFGPQTKKQCVKIQISPTPLLPKPDRADGTHTYIHYKGSLTTPPCSEGVDWFVLTKPLAVPDAQVVEFMRYVGSKQTLALNSRPRQDLGDRLLYKGPAVAAAPAPAPAAEATPA